MSVISSDPKRPRIYFMLVELSAGGNASLLIRRFKDAFDAQLTGHNGFLCQVSGGSRNPSDFDSLDLWGLLALVENGFQQVHDVRYEYVPPSPGTTPEQWADSLERRATDPRYIVFERSGSEVLHYGIRAEDLAAMSRKMCLKNLH